MLIIQIAFDFIETGSFDLQLAVKLESTSNLTSLN